MLQLLLRWGMLNGNGCSIFWAFHEVGHIFKDSSFLIHEAEHMDLRVSYGSFRRCKRRRGTLLWISLLCAMLIITGSIIVTCSAIPSVRAFVTIFVCPQKSIWRRIWASPIIFVRHLLFDPNRSILLATKWWLQIIFNFLFNGVKV